MKRFLILLCFAAVAISSYAQSGSSVSDKYNRSGLSVIPIQRGDNYDSQVARVAGTEQMGDKYDYNNIQSKYLKINKSRNAEITDSELDAVVQTQNYGKEILSYIFDRNSDGVMSDRVILQRGRYNATDQDVINAKASKIGASIIAETGHDLVSSSYIYFVDLYKIWQSSSTGSWCANAKVFIYKIALSHEDLMDFYEKTWIYDDDSEEVKAAKRRAFDNYPVKIEFVKSVTAGGSNRDFTTALEYTYGLALQKLENKLTDLSAATAVYSTHPITAKIGTKENLKNGDRYRTYSYTEDKNGEVTSVKRGLVRATVVADNSQESIGETEASRFYQISGTADIQSGWILKQSKDSKFGLSIAPKFGSMGTYWAYLDLDAILHVGKNGNISYFLLGLGMDLSNIGNDIENFGLSGDALFGYGYGIHLSRFVELMPYAGAGIELMEGPEEELTTGSSTIDDARMIFNGLGLYAEAGLRAAINICYPLQLIGAVNYDYLFPVGLKYNEYNALFANPHKSGMNYQLGIKWTF